MRIKNLTGRTGEVRGCIEVQSALSQKPDDFVLIESRMWFAVRSKDEARTLARDLRELLKMLEAL